MLSTRAILLTNHDGAFAVRVQSIDLPPLADGDVAVRVDYSCLNYKDGLAITNRSPVVRTWPMVPGIDCAGTVADSRDARFRPGDAVILNGWRAGELHWGGLAQRAHLRGDWLIHRPDGLDARRSMAIGTAGYTAMLCLLALEKHGMSPEHGDVLVTGAAGGVGSVAVALLAQLGYQAVASTGRLTESDYLRALGATQILDRATLNGPGKPLQKERFQAVIDTVGSHTLANACAQVKYGGAVAACGLAQGLDFPATVAPFILRGITLYGIESSLAPTPLRLQAWQRLAHEMDLAKLDRMTGEVSLEGALAAAADVVVGKVRGRLVVDVNR
ncbi:MAG TPA: MDR family oxidoreductase [Polyangia bacterium]|nr:MDR family oxidoreductase [Polyangia bacterium]